MKFKPHPLLIIFFLITQFSLFSKDHLLTIQNEKLKVPNFNFYVTEVIDSRDEKIGIGYFKKSKRANRSMANFSSEFTMELFSLFMNNFKKDEKKKPLIIKFNHLYLYDNYLADYGNTGVVEVNIDFYTLIDGLYYHEFSAGGHRTFTSNCTNYKFEKYTVWAVQDCFIEFQERMEKQQGYHQLVDQAELFSNSINWKLEENTLKHTRKRGLYYSFNDFRDNITDTLTNFYIKVIPNYDFECDYIKFKLDDKNVKTGEIWGFYEDEKIFMRYLNTFAQITPSDSGFILESLPYRYMTDGTHAGIWYSYLYFGITGGIAAGIIGTMAGKPGKEKFKCKLDLATGMATPIIKSNFKTVRAELVIYAQKFKHKKHKLDLYVNGEFHCNIRPKSFTSIIIEYDENPVQLCLKSELDEYCETISMDMFNIMFFEAIIKKNGTVDLFPNRGESMKKSIVHQIYERELMPICIDENQEY
jgi:hypothetical protein